MNNVRHVFLRMGPPTVLERAEWTTVRTSP
jgi:hypothetical protein